MADSILGPEEVLVGQHPVFVEVKEGVEVEYELAPLERGERAIVALTEQSHIAHGKQVRMLLKGVRGRGVLLHRCE